MKLLEAFVCPAPRHNRWDADIGRVAVGDGIFKRGPALRRSAESASLVRSSTCLSLMENRNRCTR